MKETVYRINNENEKMYFAHFCFYLLILLMPFEQLVTINGFSILKYLGLLLFLASFSSVKSFYRIVPSEFKYLLIYVIIGFILDLIGSPDIVSDFNEIIGPLLIFVLMIISYNIAIHGKINLISELLFLSSFILAFYELFFVSTIDNFEMITDGSERVAVLGTDPNFTASFMGLSIVFGILVLLKFLPTARIVKFLTFAAIPIGFLALLKTGSRGGLLAVVMGLLSILFIYQGFLKKLGGFILLSIFLFVGIFVLMKNEMYVTRIVLSLQDNDLAGRDFIWDRALHISADSPFFGYGHKRHLIELGRATGNKLRATHNTFLTVLLSTGFIGMLFFILFYVSVFIKAWRNRRFGYGPFLFTSFILCFISSISINLEITKWLWIFLSITIANNEVNRKNYILLNNV